MKWTFQSRASYRWVLKFSCNILLYNVFIFVQFYDKIKFKNRKPEDNSNNQYRNNNEKEDNLEPDLVEDYDHVEEEAESEENVGEVGGEPGEEEQVVVCDAAPGG